MKLACELAVMDMDGEITAVAVGEDSAKFHGMLRLNEEGADIVNILNMSREHDGITFPSQSCCFSSYQVHGVFPRGNREVY